MKWKTLRDFFWNRVYELAMEDRNIVAVIADMGAPALDSFRVNLPSQYIDVGIAEQNAISLSAGLSLGDKKPFVYAIAPFITLRCFEQIRVDLAAMDLPVTIVGVGAGMSYDDSGPTHHCVEDITVLSPLPNFYIHNISDPVMARAFADISVKFPHPNYVRLDRKVLPKIYPEDFSFDDGLSLLKEGNDCVIVATGNMVHRALEVSQILEARGISCGVIDVYEFPVNARLLLEFIAPVERVFTLEEHSLRGGLGSVVGEVMLDGAVSKPLYRMGIDTKKGFCYRYGGRNYLQKCLGLDPLTIAEKITTAFTGS